MARFATGKDSYAISDRSGFRYRYQDMRREWTGLLVGKDEYEPKHPQLDPPHHISDPEALRQARPEIPLPQSELGRVFTTGPSNTTPSGVNVGGQPLTIVDPIGTKFEGVSATGSVGQVEVETT